MSIVLGRRLITCAILLCTAGCRRPAPGEAAPAPPPVHDGGARFTSAARGFSVEFPFPGPPNVEELAPQESAVGRVLATSHSVGRGDTAFDVQVTRYPAGSLAKDTAALLRVERDSAVQGGRARVLRESTRTLAGPDGAPIPALELELELQGNVKAFRVTCFVGDRSFTLSAAGPAADPALNDEAFHKFLASFTLLAMPE